MFNLYQVEETKGVLNSWKGSQYHCLTLVFLSIVLKYLTIHGIILEIHFHGFALNWLDS